MGANVPLIREIIKLIQDGKLPEALVLLDSLDQKLAALQWEFFDLFADEDAPED